MALKRGVIESRLKEQDIVFQGYHKSLKLFPLFAEEAKAWMDGLAGGKK